MVTLTADVTTGIKNMTQKLIKSGIYKSQSEVVRDAIRQLAYKYGIKTVSLKEVKAITKKATKKSEETLSKAVIKMREEI